MVRAAEENAAAKRKADDKTQVVLFCFLRERSSTHKHRAGWQARSWRKDASKVIKEMKLKKDTFKTLPFSFVYNQFKGHFPNSSVNVTQHIEEREQKKIERAQNSPGFAASMTDVSSNMAALHRMSMIRTELGVGADSWWLTCRTSPAIYVVRSAEAGGQVLN